MRALWDPASRQCKYSFLGIQTGTSEAHNTVGADAKQGTTVSTREEANPNEILRESSSTGIYAHRSGTACRCPDRKRTRERKACVAAYGDPVSRGCKGDARTTLRLCSPRAWIRGSSYLWRADQTRRLQQFCFFNEIDHKAPPAHCENGGPAKAATKAELIQYLRDSFDYGNKVLAAMTDTSAKEKVPPGQYWGNNTSLTVAIAAVWHIADTYRQLIPYLRMNNIVPPATVQAPLKVR